MWPWVLFTTLFITVSTVNLLRCQLQPASTRYRSWFRYCATIRKVSISILDGVFKNFHWLNSSSRIIIFGLTQPLTDFSTGGKSGRYVGLNNLPLSCADFLKILELSTFWVLGAYLGLYRDNFAFTFFRCSLYASSNRYIRIFAHPTVLALKYSVTHRCTL
jgi:hypothetical protein